MEQLRAKKGFIIDMDGVIYHGNQILPGVPEFIQWLHDEKKEYLFLTAKQDVYSYLLRVNKEDGSVTSICNGGEFKECPGHQQRERDHGAPAPVLPGPHGGRGGAPFEHGQGCGQHRRPGQRAGSRGGDARRTDGETRNILQIGEEPVGIRQLNDDLPVNHHLQIVYGKRERHRITQ